MLNVKKCRIRIDNKDSVKVQGQSKCGNLSQVNARNVADLVLRNCGAAAAECISWKPDSRFYAVGHRKNLT